ncbi:MAG: TonB-dependent receptor [Cytophagales bacterium]|nr:MAG: TonB-dependent receptor [Cytophagales bacterium]TAF61704.1 MAG: TonB-dependent receptor [Cytophagales bacterium]
MKPILSTFFISFLVSLLAFYNATAQNIKGSVCDENGQPVNFASVLLLKAQDSSLYKVAISDTTGVFMFEGIQPGIYQVMVSFGNEQSPKSPAFELTSAGSTVELPPLKINTATELAGVAVVQKKRFVEYKADRITLIPEALISNTGLSTLEVLEKAPGLRVDENGVITYKGKAGVMVFVDGKPSYMSADALVGYLRGLPSGSVELIELMDNPPAHFDAAGSGGVVNIKLKKNTQKGFNGGLTISARQGFYGRTNNNANLNYRINKLNIFASASFNITRQFQDIDIERNYLNERGELNSQFKQNSFLKERRDNHSLRLGMDYYLNKKSTIGIVGSYGHDANDVTTINNALLMGRKGTLDSTNIGLSLSDRQWSNQSLNLNYTYQVNKQEELILSADYLVFTSAIDQSLSNKVKRANGSETVESDLLSNLPATIQIWSGKADYKKPIGKAQLDFGVKTSQVKANNTAEFFNRFDNEIRPNYELSNYFNYNEQINAAYLSTQKQYGKLGVQAGLRLENTNIEGLQYGNPTKQDSSFTRSYTNIFPTLYLNYVLDSLGHHQMNLSYGRRITRPNYQDLNPFSYPMDRFTIYSGNPFLVPTFAHNVGLTHAYKGFLVTSLNYSFVNDMITETIELGGNFFFSRPGNIGTQNTLSLSVSGQLSFTAWWTAQIYGELTNSRFSSLIYGQKLVNNGTYGAVNWINQFVLGKGWSAELSGYYQSSAYSAQFITIPLGRVGFTAQKSVWKNRGSFKLSFSDIFYTFKMGGDIKALGQATASFTNTLDTRALMLSFSYNFRKGNLLKIRQKSAADEEKNRVNIR